MAATRRPTHARSKEPEISDAALRTLNGGEAIIAARRRAHILLERLDGRGESRRGPTGGWEGIRRGSATQGLLLSEYAYDVDEFARRHIDREQLILRRDESMRRPRQTHVSLSFSAAVLGAPWRGAIGTALALSERAHRRGDEQFRVIVNAGEELALSTLADVEQTLAHPPIRAPELERRLEAPSATRSEHSRFLIARDGDPALSSESTFDAAFVLRGQHIDLVTTRELRSAER